MRPLEKLPKEIACRLHGILFDLDDTVLSHGVLERAAYDALWNLHEAKLGLVAVTGRPSGWGEVIVRQWPIDGAVTENGAVLVLRDGLGVRLVEDCSASEREARTEKLRELVRVAKREVPEAELSDDAHMRRADITWDIGERKKLSDASKKKLESLILEHGARTTSSSVHMHATFDVADKASGALRMLRVIRNEDEGSAIRTWAFIGDSGNDRACFAAFENTFGVANVKEWIGALSIPPRWVAPAPMGRGFAEISRAILAARLER